VPYGLTGTTPPSTAAATAASPFIAPTTAAAVTYDLYFIRGGILVPVARKSNVMPSSADVVTALAEGPTEAEVNAGHRSAIASADIVTRTRETANTVTVDLARTFNDIPRGDRILSLGQITLTLTARPGVSFVQYTIADTPIEVPKANGVVTRDPVTRSDYSDLLLPPSSVPSTSTTRATPTTTPPTSG
jgi:spore germination protein GerM